MVVFVNSFDKYSLFYLIAAQFEANRYAINITNMDCNTLHLSLARALHSWVADLKVAYYIGTSWITIFP